MAGHSKWANIKFRKGAQDAKRGKIFTKLIREITVSAREGGADKESNPRLRLAIEKAYRANMNKDSVERAISRGVGAGEGANFDSIRYEGYGPNGVAILVDCLTDNRNRTVSEVRHAFTKAGGNLGTDGSVAYLFERKGIILCTEVADEDELMELALDTGADDILLQDVGVYEVQMQADLLEAVKSKLVAAEYTIGQADVVFAAGTLVDLSADQAEKLIRLIDQLEDLDDVQQVYSNAAFPDM